MSKTWALISVEGIGKRPLRFAYDETGESTDGAFLTFKLPTGVYRMICKSRIRHADFFEVDEE